MARAAEASEKVSVTGDGFDGPDARLMPRRVPEATLDCIDRRASHEISVQFSRRRFDSTQQGRARQERIDVDPTGLAELKVPLQDARPLVTAPHIAEQRVGSQAIEFDEHLFP